MKLFSPPQAHFLDQGHISRALSFCWARQPYIFPRCTAVSQQLTPVFPVNWYILIEKTRTGTWQLLIKMKSVEDPVHDGSLDWNKHTGGCWIETNFTFKGSAPSFVEGKHLLRVQGDHQHHFSTSPWFLLRITWAALTAMWSKRNHYGFISLPAASLVFA